LDTRGIEYLGGHSYCAFQFCFGNLRRVENMHGKEAVFAIKGQLSNAKSKYWEVPAMAGNLSRR